MKKILIFLITFFIIIPVNIVRIKSELDEESTYKIFLNKIVTESEDALNIGKDFIVKFKNSKRIPDVLFFLSFADNDYFNILIYLKRIIFYYEDSIWWEDSIKRLTDIYLLNENYKAVGDLYNYYLENSKNFKLRYEIEINFIESLYKSKKFYDLNNFLDNLLIKASNKELLSTGLFYKGKILSEVYKDKFNALKYFINNFYYFPDTYIYFSNLIELFNLVDGDEKVYFAKKITQDNNFYLLENDLKESILSYSKRNIYNLSFVEKEIFKKVYNLYKRNYYFISYLVVKNNDIEKDDFKILFGKFMAILNKYNYPLYFSKNEIYTIYGVGPFHFFDEAKIIFEKLKEENLNGNIISINYNY